MQNKNDIQTLRAVLLYIINHLSGTQKRDVYRIVKAAFFAQEFHLVRYMQPLYKDRIVALPYGPVPSALYDTLCFVRGDAGVSSYHANDGLSEAAKGIHFSEESFSASEQPDMDFLSRSQVECLNDAIAKVMTMTFNEIRDTTHQQEWERAAATSNREMDLVAIAREGGADASTLEYLKESLAVDKLLA